jgi:Raf kinase inhibitor-like YbhB/YbcL family protein
MRGDPGWRSRSALTLVVLGILVAAACGSSDEGRTLRPPAPDQTTTTVATTTSTAAGVDAGSATGQTGGDGGDGDATATTREPLRVSSSAITEGGEFPVEFTCRGAEVSPPLLWTGVPAGTRELAVVVRDVDAEGFVHWVVAGMPASTGGIAQATAPAGAVETMNDAGRPGWAGPCPPSGTHHYDIRVYALAGPSGVRSGQPGPDAAARIEATPVLASAVLSASATAS